MRPTKRDRPGLTAPARGRCGGPRIRDRLLIVAVACLAAGAIATPAQANHEVPDETTVVARDGVLTLGAHDDGGNLCVVLGVESDGASTCGDPAVGVFVTSVEGDALYVGIAVPAAATRVDLRRAGRLLTTAATVDGAPYAGRSAGKVRFALVRLPAATREDGLRVHAVDAGGALVSVFAAFLDDLVIERRRLLAGRSGRIGWSFASSLSSTLAPSVVDLAHEKFVRCTTLDLDTGSGSEFTDVVSCQSDEPRDALSFATETLGQLSSEERCSQRFRLVHGIAESSVRRVTVLLGDGRRRAARTAALPHGDGRLYALVVAPGVAVRSVRLQRRSGAPRVLRQALAPLTVTCASASESENDLGRLLSNAVDDPPAVTPVGPVATLAGPPPFRVADGPGGTLCIAVADRPFTALGCALVSTDLSDTLGSFDRLVGPRAFVLAVPARVATVRIAGPGGRGTRDIATVPGDGYGGRYAGYVRFAAATVSSHHELSRIALLDEAGSVLHDGHENPTSGPIAVSQTPARRIAGRTGGPSLWQTTARYAGRSTRCLALTAGPPPTGSSVCQAFRATASVLLDASCATRRLTIAIATAPGARVLADTGASGSRAVALRDGAGLLTLAPGSALRSLAIARGRSTTRLRLDAPPARRQCGWTAAQEVQLG